MNHILGVCFVLFALSPCIVKETIAGLTDSIYVKPLSKNKTVHTSSSSCELSSRLQEQLQVKQELQQINELSSDFAKEKVILFAKIDADSKVVQPDFSGNDPPKYILFKRLKIALA